MNIYKAITTEVLVPIHPAGWPFIFIFVVASVLITVFWSPFALPGTLLSLWCVYFFRNPVRTTPVTDNLIVAPADGRVLSTGIAPAPIDLGLPDGEWRRTADSPSQISLDVICCDKTALPQFAKLLDHGLAFQCPRRIKPWHCHFNHWPRIDRPVRHRCLQYPAFGRLSIDFIRCYGLVGL